MTVSCAEMADLLDELALDVLPGDQRAVALAHLEGCPPCRAQLENLSEPADQLLLACRSIEPPAGFEDRVLARLSTGSRRPARWGRRLALVAAGVAAAALIGVGGVSLGHHDSHAVAAGASGARLRTVSLVSDGGHRVGDVSTYAGPPTWIFLRLDEHGGDSGAYQCVIDLEGGRTIALGAMWVSGGHGGWGERVGVDTSEVRAARLVDQSGATIATATFR